MYKEDFPQKVTIETLLLVAVWNRPAIFQGCFKITPLDSSRDPNILFFRCEYANHHSEDHIDEPFSPEAYHFSHLYNERQLLALEEGELGIEYAEYILKYALYKTLLEMQSNHKQKFLSIDDEAMKTMIKTIKPLLQRDGVWQISDTPEHIGFAVSMDFHAEEPMGQLAVKTLCHWAVHTTHTPRGSGLA